MGCASITVSKEVQLKSKDCETALKKFNRNVNKELSLLLVGAGDSGKSTIAKQMKLIYLDGFTDEDGEFYKHIIFENILECLTEICFGIEKLNYVIDDVIADCIKYFRGLKEDVIFQYNNNSFGELSTMVKNFLNNDTVKKFYQKDRSNVQLLDSCEYLLSDAERILSDSYVPNKDDILRSRHKTTGIYEVIFQIQTFSFKIIDVGGQRSERRKKWINIFDKVKSILFVTSLSEYDQVLYEDAKVNRMEESLKLFSEVGNSHYFENTPIILFLNKSDIFKKKR